MSKKKNKNSKSSVHAIVVGDTAKIKAVFSDKAAAAAEAATSLILVQSLRKRLGERNTTIQKLRHQLAEQKAVHSDKVTELQSDNLKTEAYAKTLTEDHAELSERYLSLKTILMNFQTMPTKDRLSWALRLHKDIELFAPEGEPCVIKGGRRGIRIRNLNLASVKALGIIKEIREDSYAGAGFTIEGDDYIRCDYENLFVNSNVVLQTGQELTRREFNRRVRIINKYINKSLMVMEGKNRWDGEIYLVWISVVVIFAVSAILLAAAGYGICC